MKQEDLQLLFSKGCEVKSAYGTKVLGRGFFECDLINVGMDKSELRKLVKHGALKKVTTIYKKSWRTTYVLPQATGG